LVFGTKKFLQWAVFIEEAVISIASIEVKDEQDCEK